MRPAKHSLALLGFGVTVCLALALPSPLLAQAAPPTTQKEQLLEQHLIDGTVEFGRKNYEGALKEFLAVQEADPTDFYASFFLGVTYLRLKQYEQAVQTLRQAHELKPDAIEVYLPVGEAYYLMKEYQAALPSWRRPGRQSRTTPTPISSLVRRTLSSVTMRRCISRSSGPRSWTPR